MKARSLSANETLDALEKVTTGICSFADREVGLDKARQLRDSSLRQNLAEEKALLERDCSRAIFEFREKSAQDVARVKEVFETRKVRVEKAQIRVRNEVVAQIEAVVGGRRGSLQRDLMQAGKKREIRLSEIESVFQEKSAESVSIQNRAVKLERNLVKSLGGYQGLRKELIAGLKDVSASSGEMIAPVKLLSLYKDVASEAGAFRRSLLPGWFRVLPVGAQIFGILAVGCAVPFVSQELGGPAIPILFSMVAGILVAALLGGIYILGRSKAQQFLGEVKVDLLEAKEARLQLKAEILEERDKAIKQAEEIFHKTKAAFDTGIKDSSADADGIRKYHGPDEVESRAHAIKERLGGASQNRIDSINAKLDAASSDLTAERDQRIAMLSDGSAGNEDDLEGQFDLMVGQWRETLVPVHETLVGENEAVEVSPLESVPEEWNPPTAFSESLTIGRVRYSGKMAELKLPASDRFSLPSEPEYEVPLRLRLPDAGSILLETKNFGRDDAVSFLNYLVLGWLSGSPAGRLSFSLIDPVGLGESFAGLMHLADYEETLINTRIRTQSEQIEQRLGELCDHMEKVIQMYLRSDYETITQYNEAAGTIAERYHFLVVADFPHGFSDIAAKRLLSIAASGARCGVFLLIHCDQRADLPVGFQIDDIRKASLCLRSNLDGFFLKDNPVSGSELILNEAPAPDLFAKWVHRMGEANRDSNRIEVPFSFISPPEGALWTSSTAKELTVPIGRSGATKLQELALGKGTCQHALIAGKTGSGKSTLFHIMITNLALWCDPNEVEFYLIDFKKGVEFKCYADHLLPHARVVAIESDREFGLSVLERLDEELKRRGELFRAAGVQDVAAYRSVPEGIAMPRTLLLIDEFQEFFTEDDQISQKAAVLLDRIVRQGRAFGVHAVLGSQTLGGAFTLARATLGQMTVRIALACNEADAYLIMDDSNPAPRMLTRPGEGIYNERAGAIEANSPFQVVWLGEEERNGYLVEVARLAKERGIERDDRVIFEGNAPASIEEDVAIDRIVRGTGEVDASAIPRFFLGAPNAIKGPTEVRLARQSGANVMVVGQREDVMDSFVAVSLRVLRAEQGDAVRLIVIDNRFSQRDDKTWFCEAVRAIGSVESPAMSEMESVINSLAAEMKSLSEGETPAGAKTTILFIPGLHRYKKLRYEEDFSFSLSEDNEAKASASLQDLICEGPGWGYHLITSLDSYNSVQRTLGRKAASEFEKKVLFQMSAADSASLIDTGKASDLGLNRALFYDEPSGVAEIFRPFAQPPLDWFQD